MNEYDHNILHAMYINNEVDLPDSEWEIARNNPVRRKIMIDFHSMKPLSRFMEWLESEGMTVCQGAMPQPREKVEKAYKRYEYHRRGLSVDQADSK